MSFEQGASKIRGLNKGSQFLTGRGDAKALITGLKFTKASGQADSKPIAKPSGLK